MADGDRALAVALRLDGAITVEKGVTVTVTPVGGDSVASLMSRLVQRAEALIGYDWQAVADAAGVLTLVDRRQLRPHDVGQRRRPDGAGVGHERRATRAAARTRRDLPVARHERQPGTPTTTRSLPGDGSMVVPGRRAPGRVVLVAYDVHASLWSLEASSPASTTSGPTVLAACSRASA